MSPSGGGVGACLSFVGSGLGERADGWTDDDGRVTFNDSWNYIHATSATDSAKGGHSQRINERGDSSSEYTPPPPPPSYLLCKYTYGGITNL